MNEEISALVDGEGSALERERALKALGADPALLATWERYHLVGTVLRRELDLVLPSTVAERIQSGVARQHPDASNLWARTPRLFKAVSGLAIAASVAAVAILNLSPLTSSVVAPVARTTPAQKPASMVADTRPTLPEQQRALSPYLVHHSEFAPAAGMSGMLPYVRVVGYDNNLTAENKNGE